MPDSKISRRGRRWFLRGAAGALVAIPVLPSLLRAPRASGQVAPRPKHFVALTFQHGGVWDRNFWPADATLTESMTYAGHTIRRGDLVPTVSSGVASLSRTLSAPSSVFTASLARKMNVIAGFDVTSYIGHHHGGYLGNFNAAAEDLGMAATPTIDQVMAYSSGFYGPSDPIVRRSIALGNPTRPVSWGFSNPSAPEGGAVQPVATTNESLALFDELYTGEDSGEPAPVPRTPLVDRVLASYRSLRQSDRRLSSADRRRLDEHMARLSELQSRMPVASLTCGDVTRPSESAARHPMGSVRDMSRWFELMNELVTVAFTCGSTRIATYNPNEDAFIDYSGGTWHDVPHAASSSSGQSGLTPQAAQEYLVETNRNFFEYGFLDLVSRLDSVTTPEGGTLLDDSLVFWTCESGHITHDNDSTPVVTAGGAGGAFRTGSYIDYRNHSVAVDYPTPHPTEKWIPGLVYAQWLGAVLEAMGVPRSEFENEIHQMQRPSDVTGGYGPIVLVRSQQAGNRGDRGFYTDAVRVAGEIPPYLRPA